MSQHDEDLLKDVAAVVKAAIAQALAEHEAKTIAPLMKRIETLESKQC